MLTKSRFTLVVALVAGAVLVGGTTEASAKGAKRTNRTDTVRLARPSGGADTNAKGTITIAHGRAGDDATLHLRGLVRRATYRIVDRASGDVLGEVRANAKGRATFDLTPGVGGRSKRAASVEGTDGTTVPDVVDVVDPTTGDTVLTGDTTGDLQALFGYATFGNATETASVEMGSDPALDTQYFSFTYTTVSPTDPWGGGFYEYVADTASGDDLPLGAASVIDLAGKDFQVRDADGKVAFKGTLPDVEAYDVTDPALPPCGDWMDWTGGGDPGNWGDWTGTPPGQDWGSGFDGGNGDGFMSFFMGALFGGPGGGPMMGGAPARNGRMKTGARADGTTDPGSDPAPAAFTLWLETADGFVKVADLADPLADWGGGWMDGGPGGWGDDWGGDWGNEWTWDWTWDDTTTWTDPAATDPTAAGQDAARGARARNRGRRR